jgi:tRNA-splicing ligase RtcB
LLIKLGVPATRKTNEDFEVPEWIRLAPRWIQRNFLAGLFGAELSKPATVTGHPYTFGQPTLTVSKSRAHKVSGIRFLLQIKRLLDGFGVKSYLAKPIPVTQSTVGLRLVIRSKEDNLIRLWTQIGYEYNSKRQRLASLAAEYLKMKTSHRGELKDRSRKPDFPTFKEFVRRTEAELGPSGMVYDTVVANEPVEHHGAPVYDFTVNHKDHNFVANGLVVSNCGVRLIRTGLVEQEVRPVLPKLLDALFQNVPSGLGSRGKVRVTTTELEKVVLEGVEWAVDHGYGWTEDKQRCEENGCMETANPDKVSSVAKQRGSPQLGSLGSGNHFLEIERVDKIFDPKAAAVMGIDKEGQILVLVHTGSRGFGYQVCSDYLRVMERALEKYNIRLPDRQLACAPLKTREAEDYIPAMSCAANFAWVNRQMVTHWTREAFERVFGKAADAMGMKLVYDVAHNIAKIEEHELDGGKRAKVVVHRKGATRCFPPGHPEIPPEYQPIGQPVLIPGSMGTASWVLLGTETSMKISFGTTAHGAGRFMSRAAAKRRNPAHEVERQLGQRGVLVRAENLATVSEEAPEAYKNVDRVAEVSHNVGIATKVARLTPIGVTKG